MNTNIMEVVETRGTRTVEEVLNVQEVLSYSTDRKEFPIHSSVVVLRHDYSRDYNEDLEWMDIHDETVGQVYTVLEKTEDNNYLLSNGYYYAPQWLVRVMY